MQDVMNLVDPASQWVHENGRYYALPDKLPDTEKWIVRSALQKAIRRGNTELALEMGFKLLLIDQTYTWYAINTVAVEDVGFGNPPALLWSNLAMLKTFRLQVGELPLLSALITSLCEHSKTRSCCELSWVVDEAHKPILAEYSELTTPELVSIVEQPDAGMCYAALAVITGIVPKEVKSRPRDREGLELAREVMRSQLPPDHALACEMLTQRPADNMSVAVFPTFRMGSGAGDIEIEEDHLPESVTIKGYASEAWDMHTMEGKKALKALHSKLKRKYEVLQLIPGRRVVSAMGNAVFTVEGAQLDKRIINDDLMALKKIQDDLGLISCGLPEEYINQFLDVVRDHIPMLNEMREWSANL